MHTGLKNNEESYWTLSQSTLPAEIICHILCFLEPLDVVRLRVLSKQFRELSYGPAIWRHLYSNARLPRPAGPYPHQSVSFLERTLIQSARLTESWTTKPIQDIARVQMRIGGLLPGGVTKLIGDRWLASCESRKQIVLHRVDSAILPSTLLRECDSGQVISSWDACFMVSPVGEFVYVAFCDRKDGESHSSWKLLEFRVNSERGEVYDHVSLEIPTPNFHNPVVLYGGSRFIHIPAQKLSFDTQTRIFCKLPDFSIALSDHGPIEFPLSTPFLTLSTNTHIIALFAVCLDSSSQFSTLVQAFTPPSDPTSSCDRTRILRLTHEAFVRNEFVHLRVIRRSVIDPISGSTNLRFLQILDNGRCGPCIDFTLPKSLPNSAVMPISIQVHNVFKDVNTLPSIVCTQSSPDGHVRGLSISTTSIVGKLGPTIMKFSLDASQDECTATFGEPSEPDWKSIKYLPYLWFSFDFVRGRICYRLHARSENDSFDVMLLDII